MEDQDTAVTAVKDKVLKLKFHAEKIDGWQDPQTGEIIRKEYSKRDFFAFDFYSHVKVVLDTWQRKNPMRHSKFWH